MASTTRSKKYLAYIRSLDCGYCGAQRTVAHHHRIKGITQKGTGIKVDDYAAIPLCPSCHADVHRGFETFEKCWEEAVGTTISASIKEYISNYLHLEDEAPARIFMERIDELYFEDDI